MDWVGLGHNLLYFSGLGGHGWSKFIFFRRAGGRSLKIFPSVMKFCRSIRVKQFEGVYYYYYYYYY